MKKQRNEAVQALCFVLPSLVLILTFSVLPILMNGYISFTKYNIIQKPQWVGLANFSRMFKDQYVWAALKNTTLFTLFTVPIQTFVSLVFAAWIATNFQSRYGRMVKSALFIPVIASAVLVGTLWSLLLSPRGPVNMIMQGIGLDPINWLGGKLSSLLSVGMVSVWKNIGYFLVIFYAGIMDIPASHYEAAKVDGATVWQQFFYITLPSLSSVTYLVVTLGTIWSFQVFDIVYTMTGGGPGLSTVTLVLTIYNAAFKEYNMGYASAVALLMFVFVILIQALQKRLVRAGREG
ncbi:sugar ABC transporter permease [Sphaerochaeta sp.]|nr:sugar ABC transporter permease [Sphaerochaeta sp.]MDD3457258.1 sugar ABC transporter permease [Sphaerochaeta sp.]MDD4039004.1 sugar ABC transporter permease [Sphaerochaeta sp.]NLE16267.1 sugar ABC transporter permease [Spirochaetales bacterium]